jgi:hypothetical protein
MQAETKQMSGRGAGRGLLKPVVVVVGFQEVTASPPPGTYFFASGGAMVNRFTSLFAPHFCGSSFATCITK